MNIIQLASLSSTNRNLGLAKPCTCTKKSNAPTEKESTMKTILQAKVVDSDNNFLPGSHIMNLTTAKATITGDDGVFKINASNGDLIRVTFVGMKDKTLRAEKINGIVQLDSDGLLDEVIINGSKIDNTGLWVGLSLLVMYAYAKTQEQKPKIVNG